MEWQGERLSGAQEANWVMSKYLIAPIQASMTSRPLAVQTLPSKRKSFFARLTFKSRWVAKKKGRPKWHAESESRPRHDINKCLLIRGECWRISWSTVGMIHANQFRCSAAWHHHNIEAGVLSLWISSDARLCALSSCSDMRWRNILARNKSQPKIKVLWRNKTSCNPSPAAEDVRCEPKGISWWQQQKSLDGENPASWEFYEWKVFFCFAFFISTECARRSENVEHRVGEFYELLWATLRVSRGKPTNPATDCVTQSYEICFQPPAHAKHLALPLLPVWKAKREKTSQKSIN